MIQVHNHDKTLGYLCDVEYTDICALFNYFLNKLLLLLFVNG